MRCQFEGHPRSRQLHQHLTTMPWHTMVMTPPRQGLVSSSGWIWLAVIAVVLFSILYFPAVVVNEEASIRNRSCVGPSQHEPFFEGFMFWKEGNHLQHGQIIGMFYPVLVGITGAVRPSVIDTSNECWKVWGSHGKPVF